ncbi:MAG TPA: FAD:protein FMN transferase [Chryseosolibacter sp.]
MGTSYHITYFDDRQRDFKAQIDSLLVQVNKAISTYDSTSEISRFNSSARGIQFQRPHLYEALKAASEIYKKSGGAFDPTVMPLVNAWGFGPGRPLALSAQKVDSLKELVGFDKVKLRKRGVKKKDPRLQIDLGGIGQGYGADVIFQFLQSKGIKNMLVELGGEGVAQGENIQKHKPWLIGILDPASTLDHQFFKAYVRIHNKAFTTSGNYFNYRVIGGRKYGHTIDPVTGYPIQSSLLSASVFSGDCSAADGWATAFMVMGVEKAIEKLKTLPGIDALLIYSAEDGTIQTYITPGIKEQVDLEP